jgi:hypothetical protein
VTKYPVTIRATVDPTLGYAVRNVLGWPRPEGAQRWLRPVIAGAGAARPGLRLLRSFVAGDPRTHR